ncbi:MAG: amino acid ABC transporter permease [Phreatobacter sp.]
MDQIAYYFFNFSLMSGHWPAIGASFLITVEMAALTILIGIPLGLFLAVLRLYGIRPLNWLIIFYIDFFRSIPQLVIIVLVFFALPYLDLVVSAFWATVLALSFVLSAFAEEVFWASITAVPAGQWEAGRSSGLGFNQTLGHIILPQAVRMSIPPLTNRAIGITKGTALGSVIAVPELLNVTQSIQSNVANPTALTVATMLFLVLFLPLVLFTRWIESRYRHAGR